MFRAEVAFGGCGAPGANAFCAVALLDADVLVGVDELNGAAALVAADALNGVDAFVGADALNGVEGFNGADAFAGATFGETLADGDAFGAEPLVDPEALVAVGPFVAAPLAGADGLLDAEPLDGAGAFDCPDLFGVSELDCAGVPAGGVAADGGVDGSPSARSTSLTPLSANSVPSRATKKETIHTAFPA